MENEKGFSRQSLTLGGANKVCHNDIKYITVKIKSYIFDFHDWDSNVLHPKLFACLMYLITFPT